MLVRHRQTKEDRKKIAATAHIGPSQDDLRSCLLERNRALTSWADCAAAVAAVAVKAG